MEQSVNPRLSIVGFERLAAASDRLGSDMDTALLGLVGEVGSLVSALKKKRRDTDGFLGYHDAVLEELGDVLWYVSAVARRGGTALEDVLSRAIGDAAAQGTLTLGALAPRGSRGIDEAAFEKSLLELAGDTQPPDSAPATDQATHPCPCCGGRMNIIETFNRGSTPQYRPPPPTVIRIDTS